MGVFVKGEVVIVPFPFSDLTNFTRRPAVVIAQLEGNDVILCQITSQARTDSHAIAITPQMAHPEQPEQPTQPGHHPVICVVQRPTTDEGRITKSMKIERSRRL